MRSDYGADLVYALTSQRELGFCGMAYLRTKGRSRESAAGSAVGGIWYGTENGGCLGLLHHEVGHNLGLVHHVGSGTTNIPFHPQGRGYVNKNVDGRQYGTVMSTWGGNYGRFSAGFAHHDGLPMGDESANAAEILLYTIEDASNYSPTKVPDPAPDHDCAEGPTRSCMQKGRFLVEARVSYVDSAGTPVNDAPARVEDVGLGDTSSLFHFFDRSNPELLVKVLDGCGVNGKYWVFGSAATDLDYSVLVTDNATGVTLPYRRNGANPLINDAEAFPCGRSGSDSSQSALLYFFDRNNVEVLIKVLDGCGVNGHRWVFVAPVDGSGLQPARGESPPASGGTHRNPARADGGRCRRYVGVFRAGLRRSDVPPARSEKRLRCRRWRPIVRVAAGGA